MMNIETKSYESLLPFLVVEAISSQGFSFNSMSVRMIDRGWAWLVSGRKLLIWKFKDTKASNLDRARRMLSPCFELQLPQSDLVHRADLIHVFFMPQNHNISLRATTVPAALVVSPEGTVRFWSSIANERFTESPAADLQGQEFCALSHLSAFEYLLGTTTGLVYLLTIDVTAHDSKSMLVLSALNAPSSLLSGISRRVTTLFFGPMVTDLGADTKRPLIAVPKYSQSMIEKTGTSDRIFFVMSSSFKLRQWSRSNEGIHSTNHLTREWDLQRNIYTRLISDLSLSESDSINFWPIDMITTKSKELLMLILTLDTTRGNAINYATCLFNPYQVGDSIANLTVLRSHTWHYSNESDDQLLSLRFLERRANSPLCFMYDKKFLFLVQVDQDILDAIDFGIQDDGILGAGIVEDHPILFTQRDGLTYVAPVANNKSRMNETSIQLEHLPMHATRAREINQSRQDDKRQIPDRTDPMLIEIDTDDDEETENQRSRGPNQSSLQRDENINKSNVDKSLNQSSSNKSINKSAQRRKGDELDALLRENKEFEWIQQIDSKQYSEASQTLEKLAEASEILQDRKETLLALSKLAKLAT